LTNIVVVNPSDQIVITFDYSNELATGITLACRGAYRAIAHDEGE